MNLRQRFSELAAHWLETLQSRREPPRCGHSGAIVTAHWISRWHEPGLVPPLPGAWCPCGTRVPQHTLWAWHRVAATVAVGKSDVITAITNLGAILLLSNVVARSRLRLAVATCASGAMVVRTTTCIAATVRNRSLGLTCDAVIRLLSRKTDISP